MSLKRYILNDVPRIGWGQIDGRAPTDYSLAGCLGNIIGYIEGFDQKGLDNLNQMFMNVSGMCYATLWSDDFDHMVNELHRINYMTDIIERCMRYAGRNYVYYELNGSPINGLRDAVISSIDSGNPVLAEFIAGIPEFSIITGYDNYGDTLTGWTYCTEFAKESEVNGMFRVAVDWLKPCNRMLIVGEKSDISLSHKDIFDYAIQTMERDKSQDTSYKTFTAGIKALECWHAAMADSTNSLIGETAGANNQFLHLMILNLAEPRAYFWGIANELSQQYSTDADLKALFESMVRSSTELSDYARAMWKVKDSDLPYDERRIKWCELIQSAIDGDRKLLSTLKDIVRLLP